MNDHNLRDLVHDNIEVHNGISPSMEIVDMVCDHITMMYECAEIPYVSDLVRFQYNFIEKENLESFKKDYEYECGFEIVGEYNDLFVIYADSGNL